MAPPPGSHAVDNPNITPENYQQAQPGRDFIPLLPGRQQQQQQVQQQPPRSLQDKEQEDSERNRDVALVRSASEKVGVTEQQFIRDLDTAKAKHIRELALHDPIFIPIHQAKPNAEQWLNPLTGEYEEQYKREGEDKDAWISQPFKRYKIDKYSWDEAERHRIKMVLLPDDQVLEKRKLDAQWLEYLAYKFFNMTADDMRRAQWDVLRDYIISALFRTNTGLPYYQSTSDNSLQGNSPIR